MTSNNSDYTQKNSNPSYIPHPTKSSGNCRESAEKDELPSSSVAAAEAESEPLELPPPSSAPPGQTDARQRSLEAEREDMAVANGFPENRRTLAQRRARRVKNPESLGGRRREADGDGDGGDKWQRGEREKR